MKSRISEIIESLERKGLALFCGAGISKNSGMPLANELRQSVLKRLFAGMNEKDNREDVHNIMQSDLPFEAFMENISDNSDISAVLDLFKGGEPNTNHIMIAKLAKTGCIKTILTTNFDLLIEKALEEEGLVRDKHFRVYHTEKQFSGIDFESNKGKVIRVLKIHGSAEDKKSIRVTLKAIAGKSLSDKRMNLIKFLFSSGKHRKVLVIGYSCSDVFDITPQIQSISRNLKEIAFIDHNPTKMGVMDMKMWNSKNPFKKFPGVKLLCDTDSFIERLWKSCNHIMKGNYSSRKSKIDWEKHVIKWAKVLEQSQEYPRYFMAGRMLAGISDFDRAVKYYEKSLEIAEEIDFKKGRLESCMGLGNAYFELGNFRRAIRYYKKSLDIAGKTGNKKGELLGYSNVANAYHGLADFSRTIEYSQRCLKICREIGDAEIEIRCYVNLGNAYAGLGDYNRAVGYYEGSLRMSKEIGDKGAESTCCTNLGHTHYDLGHVNSAAKYYEESLKIAKEIGDRKAELESYIGLGTVCSYLENYSEAIRYHKKSLETARDIKDRASELQCYIGLGHVYYKLRHFNRAIESYVESLEIAREVGGRDQEMKSYRHLGNAYSGLKNPGRAICYYEESLKIAEKIGNGAEKAASYVNLGSSYYELGDFSKAIDLYLKAKNILRTTKQIHRLREVCNNLSVVYEKIGDDENAEKYRDLASLT